MTPGLGETLKRTNTKEPLRKYPINTQSDQSHMYIKFTLTKTGSSHKQDLSYRESTLFANKWASDENLVLLAYTNTPD